MRGFGLGSIGRGGSASARAAAGAAAVAALAASLAAAEVAGAAKVVQRSATVLISQGEVKRAVAVCPRGTGIVSGGFQTTRPPSGEEAAVPFESRRVGKRRWRVGAATPPAGGVFARVTAYAYCSRKPGRIRTRSRRRSFPLVAEQFSVREAIARCPRRTRLVSGGFATQPSNEDAVMLVFGSRRLGAGWRASAIVGGPAESGTRSITAFAYCRRGGPRLRWRQGVRPLPQPEGARTVVQVPCRGRSRLVGGGFYVQPQLDLSGDNFGVGFIYEARRTSPRRWRTSVIQAASDAEGKLARVRSFAGCAR